jgi:hypothetical protein
MTMVVSGGATLLALAGVVTAAVLIFTASLAVLWPVLIGCACAAAVGAIIVIVVRCAGAKNGGAKEKDDGESSKTPLQENATFQISNTEENIQNDQISKDDIFISKKVRDWHSNAPKHKSPLSKSYTSQSPDLYDNVEEILTLESVPVQSSSIQDTTIAFTNAINDMEDKTTIADVLKTLEKLNNITQLSENDRNEICKLVNDIAKSIGRSMATLGNLRQEITQNMVFFGEPYALSLNAIPFLISILALLSDSESCLIFNATCGTISPRIAFLNDCVTLTSSSYSILNHTSKQYYGKVETFECWKRCHSNDKGAFVFRYVENRRLVVDHPPQSGNPSQMKE